jgi:lysophospholipase L1-like esterase
MTTPCVPQARPSRRAPFLARLAQLGAISLLGGVLAAEPGQPEPKAAQTGGEPTMKFGALKAGKVLFLGNSITLHGPLATIGWAGNWGMAATAEDKDYVHLILSAIAKAAGKASESRVDNIADIERQYATIDIEARLKDHLAFKADIVVLAIGENTPALATDDEKRAFQASLVRLLTALKQSSAPALFVRSCFWADAAKDEALRQACAAVGGTFVDISSLGQDPANAARSERTIEHAGVAGHPGDRGMQAIANAILAAMESRQ